MKIGIIIIHGMGNHEHGYSYNFQEKFNNLYNGNKEIIFEEVLWNDVVKYKETELYNAVNSKLEFDDVRRFMIYFVGDIIAYQKTSYQEDSYNKINEKIFKSYKNLESKLSENDQIFFVAHSLGGVILSNFIYDNQKNTPINFNRLFTLGTPLALYSLKYKSLDLPIKLNNEQKWINIYDKDDVLAYPISELSDKYITHNENGKIIDEEINVGNILTSWNPASHCAYWTDKDVIKRIIREID